MCSRPARCTPLESSWSWPSPRIGRNIAWQGKGADEVGIDKQDLAKSWFASTRTISVRQRWMSFWEILPRRAPSSAGVTKRNSKSSLPKWSRAILRRYREDWRARSHGALSERLKGFRMTEIGSPAAKPAPLYDLRGKKVYVAGHNGMVGVGASPPAGLRGMRAHHRATR